MTTAVVIAGDERMRSLLRAGVGAAVDEVIEASEPEEVPSGGAPVLAVVAVGDDARGWIRRASARLPAETAMVVVLPEIQPREVVDALQAEPRVVAVLAAERATPAAMAALARRLTGGGFGLAAWLPAGSRIHAAEVASYADKVACIDKLQRHAEEALVRGKYRDAIAECADELMMNALYAAPRAAATGAPTSKQSIAERAARTVRVEWARAGDWFHLAVRDGWGALRREALLDSWSGAIAAGARADGSNAAGLGLSIVAAASSSLHFASAPGVATECVCSFDTRQTKLHLQEVGLVRETDAGRIAELRRALRPVPPPVASTPSAVRVLIAALILVVVILLLALVLR